MITRLMISKIFELNVKKIFLSDQCVSITKHYVAHIFYSEGTTLINNVKKLYTHSYTR